MSGTKGKSERPGLKALMEILEPGDTLFIESFSRLSRCTRDLLAIVEELNQREVIIHSEHEKFDTSTPTEKLILTMIAALSQFERDIIAERTEEGLASVRARGHMGGRPKADQKKAYFKLTRFQRFFDLPLTIEKSCAIILRCQLISKSILFCMLFYKSLRRIKE